MGLQWLLSPASHKDNLCPDFVLRHGQYGREDLMVGEGKVRRVGEGKVRRVGSLQPVQLYRQGSLDPRLRAHQLCLHLQERALCCVTDCACTSSPSLIWNGRCNPHLTLPLLYLHFMRQHCLIQQMLLFSRAVC